MGSEMCIRDRIITKLATSRQGIQPNNTNSLSVQSHALQNAPMLGRPQGLPREQGLPVFSHQFLHVHSTTGLRIFGQCIKHCQRQLRCIEHRRKIGHNTSIVRWLRCRKASAPNGWHYTHLQNHVYTVRGEHDFLESETPVCAWSHNRMLAVEQLHSGLQTAISEVPLHFRFRTARCGARHYTGPWKPPRSRLLCWPWLRESQKAEKHGKRIVDN